MGLCRREDDGIGRREPVGATRACGREGDLCIERDDVARPHEGEDAFERRLVIKSRRPFRDLHLNDCRNEAHLRGREVIADPATHV